MWLFGKGYTRSAGGIERSESGASLWMKRRELVWMRALKVEFSLFLVLDSASGLSHECV